MDSDDVIDYMIMEAVTVRELRSEKNKKHEAEVKDWKKDKSGLDALREAAS